MNIKQLAEQEKELLISLRRHFHEHPELSEHEVETMEFIKDRLADWDIPYVQVPLGGIFGFIDSGKPGPTVLMRADIDALPIEEDPNNLKGPRVCVSNNKGVMHACGHDGHMAMLLTEAKILSAHKEDWQGKIVLMFEEAEEMGEHGLAELLRYLRDEKIHIDYCYGTHTKWDLPAGKVGILYGTTMAGAHFFTVKINGQGGHGARPDMAINPIECFVSFANQLRDYRMRSVAPDERLTYSFGYVKAGTGPNIIPDTLTFSGTARCTKNEDGLAFRKILFETLEAACKLYGCTAEAVHDHYFPATVNTDELVDLARRAVNEKLGADVLDKNCPLWMATESFAVTESIYPGVFIFTGIYDEEIGSGAPHHTPQFDIAEEGLLTGVEAGLAIVIAMLEEKPKTESFVPYDLEKMWF